MEYKKQAHAVYYARYHIGLLCFDRRYKRGNDKEVCAKAGIRRQRTSEA